MHASDGGMRPQLSSYCTTGIFGRSPNLNYVYVYLYFTEELIEVWPYGIVYRMNFGVAYAIMVAYVSIIAWKHISTSSFARMASEDDTNFSVVYIL